MTHRTLTPPVGPQDHVLGRVDAPIVLVEYGDYQCPHCAVAHDVVQRLLAEFGERLCYVFRNFPLTDIHPDAQAAAEAAESVAAHAGADAFWDVHDMLFANQEALGIDDLLGYAEAAGADVELVARDLSRRSRQPRVAADMASGDASGVMGTPTFFVNARRFDGDWSDPDVFAAALGDGTLRPA